jgi:hypothetical protein
MLAKERDEMAYLREFARAAKHECGGEDWPCIEALLRNIWPQQTRRLTLDEAVEVVRGHFGRAG